ncbi:hypothetical protein JCM3774_001685 [Rhodotorula dairenensis]
MATYDSDALLAVRTTATVGLGVATGLMLSYPLLSWPSIYAQGAPHDIKGRLDLFWNLYSNGANAMKKLLPSATALLAYASYTTRPPADYLPASLVGRHRKASSLSEAILALAAALTFASVPLTYALIMPINNRLKAIKDAKASGTVSAEGATPDAEADQLIQHRWMSLHYGRILLCGTAFLLSVAELGSA